MIEGSGSGSIHPTSGSGSGSGRPKNMWIRNTACKAAASVCMAVSRARAAVRAAAAAAWRGIRSVCSWLVLADRLRQISSRAVLSAEPAAGDGSKGKDVQHRQELIKITKVGMHLHDLLIPGIFLDDHWAKCPNPV
jgi:hypothetical protein